VQLRTPTADQVADVAAEVIGGSGVPKPTTTTTNNRRTGRKTQSRTAKKDSDTMSVTTLPEQATQTPPAGMDDRPLLDEKQAGQRIGVCQRTMYALRASGQLVHVRVGRRIFYRGEDIDQFLAAQSRTDIPTEFRLSEQQLAKRSRTRSRTKAGRGRKG
jgi:hypothetical protein